VRHAPADGAPPRPPRRCVRAASGGQGGAKATGAAARGGGARPLPHLACGARSARSR
jgi:hypothetical protein